MTTSSSLIKTILHKSLAEGVYRDVVTKASNYYYFLGRTLKWDDEVNPPYPIDSYAYERATRDDIITLKQINPSDISFVIPRVNWLANTRYDMYDDQYSTEVQGLNIIAGGIGYTSLPTIIITGGGGTGAAFTPVLFDGRIIGVDLVSRGTGYTSIPTVTITGGGGTGAVIKAVVTIGQTGAQKLEEAQFYVMTEDYNVYKCLDNNNGAKSTVKPLGTAIAPISTSDGYIWKYMYNVPINLRNKFLSDTQIPVVSALTNQFYSNGALDSIIINNKGSGYTYASISLAAASADGYRVEDPIFIKSITVSGGGTGYTSPTVVISDPVTSYSSFLSGAVVFLGQKLVNSNYDFYEVVTPGTLTTTEPSHVAGTIQNGTAALKYLGTRAKGYATVSDGVITDVTLIGSVLEINISNAGSGYTSAPAISFSGGGGSGAIATSKLYNDSVLYCTVTTRGDGYVSDPTVTFGTAYSNSKVCFVGEQYFNGSHLYTVTGAGTTVAPGGLHATGPTVTLTSVNSTALVTGTIYTIATLGTTDFTTAGASDNKIGTVFVATGTASGTGTATTPASEVNGTVTFTYAGEKATGTVTRRFGAGYYNPPTISFVEAGHTGTNATGYFQIQQSQAKLIPVLDNGQITSVIVNNPGIGYSSADIIVSGDGQDAALSADLNVGTIQSQQANNEILTTPGTINAIPVISGGYGYGVANIIIEGDGTGASATATLNSATGAITKINITNPGQNYTFATVTITGNGYGATARAVMCPYGGHGKNAPEELFAQTLMFYSNISTDLNQGVVVNNDYRQVGIIKNPRIYNSDQRYEGKIGSGCFVIEGNINTTYFPRDTDVTVNRVIGETTYARKYRVVAANSTSALLQSLDNDIPQINDTFQSSALHTFSVSSVGNPTVDKYSGQMMFIDNKSGFTPSTEETVTLRTVIKF
jgi:hypothetical protein